MNQFNNLKSLQSVSRRTILKLFTVASATGLVGYTRFSKPQPTVFVQDNLDLPRYLNKSKSVVVVGGGLAGLACAYELSQRGFRVTLLEKSPQLGGKIASWSVNFGEEKFMMEHGFHGFFPQYYNLKSLVSELNITDNFKSLEFYSMVFREGKYDPEVFRPSSSAFPWNIVDLAISSPNRFRWGINLVKPKHWEVFQAIGGFKVENTYQKLDNLSVAEWVEKDFPQGLYDLYFLPFAKSSLNAPDKLSVAELMQFFHFYFFGNPEGLAFHGTKQDMGTSLVQPITQEIKSRGGKIFTDIGISKINWKKGKVDSISYQLGEAKSRIPFWVERNLEINKQDADYFGSSDSLFTIKAGSDEAISLTCTHQGCTVKLAEDGQFYCPCHGAVYDRKGKVLAGPAKRNLSRYKITQSREYRVQLVGITENKSEIVPTEIQADYYVFATDIPGVKHLFNVMEGDVNQKVQDRVKKLNIADPFAVCRFWFDRDFDWKNSNFTSLSGYQLTDSITLYHRIQEQFIKWHEKTGGSVVELHAYCYKEKEFPTQENLLTTFEQELYEIVPELKDANMLHRELVNQKNFSGYPPGSYQERPETNSGVDNLIFAGDWVKMPFPCGLMERAISSGLLAANEIFEREGLQKRKLLSVNPEGILKI
ncbi:MAG: FAD-dependent oxidoreductase [Okeania sp. SIO2G4]|uniref:FAD-dependent oxidoreductase n=1 Tax=unclassified Okeania TaxID=2634635 RepID=UPI0013BA48FF|nr:MULTISPECIES: FAD-dependent oxidoreductase [unclassified Okeania]NEP39653.1 FAD-dependent oxidoreductase [Okeania sp. SIO2H7]NEP73116.1 FAD-dependent oxidoreductase [Okeania sp. SIO2G5]NEP93939.1 FAD-dependent oxidoreductase [Okeania sp. SIO2F5]NEQ92582.1 FAD-dependent oxidoreductase [Okeania sp. SIO2G4]